MIKKSSYSPVNISLRQKALMWDNADLFSISNAFFENKENIMVTSAHWHDEFELSYLIDGEISFECDGRVYALKQNAIFIKNPGEIHSIVCKTPNVNFITILLKTPFMGIDIRRNIFINCIERDDELAQNFSVINHENEARLIGYKLRIYREICSCLSTLSKKYIVKCLSLSEFESKFQKNLHVNKILSFVDENFHQNISIDDIASYVGVSSAYAMRLFKKKIGKTIGEYINNVRLLSAEKALSNIKINTPISQIAKASGFENPRHFTWMYKKEFGITPMQQRQKARLFYKDIIRDEVHFETNRT